MLQVVGSISIAQLSASEEERLLLGPLRAVIRHCESFHGRASRRMTLFAPEVRALLEVRQSVERQHYSTEADVGRFRVALRRLLLQRSDPTVRVELVFSRSALTSVNLKELTEAEVLAPLSSTPAALIFAPQARGGSARPTAVRNPFGALAEADDHADEYEVEEEMHDDGAIGAATAADGERDACALLQAHARGYFARCLAARKRKAAKQNWAAAGEYAAGDHSPLDGGCICLGRRAQSQVWCPAGAAARRTRRDLGGGRAWAASRALRIVRRRALFDRARPLSLMSAGTFRSRTMQKEGQCLWCGEPWQQGHVGMRHWGSGEKCAATSGPRSAAPL